MTSTLLRLSTSSSRAWFCRRQWRARVLLNKRTTLSLNPLSTILPCSTHCHQGAPGRGDGLWELVRGVSAFQTGRGPGGEQAHRRGGEPRRRGQASIGRGRTRGLLREGRVLVFTRLRSTHFSLPVLRGRTELFLPTPGISPSITPCKSRNVLQFPSVFYHMVWERRGQGR